MKQRWERTHKLHFSLLASRELSSISLKKFVNEKFILSCLIDKKSFCKNAFTQGTCGEKINKKKETVASFVFAAAQRASCECRP